MIDVDKLLQFDYLNDLMIQISGAIKEKEGLLVSKYSFEILYNMPLEEVNNLFNSYGINNDNYIKYIESDFLDESWEFADLYSDDISYSFEQKKELKDLALNEIILLNQKIDVDNEKVQDEIDVLDDYLKKLNIFNKALNDDDLIVDEEVEELKDFIMYYPLIKDEDRFKLSVNIVKYLIKSEKIILLKKELVDTKEFEEELEQVRSEALYKENENDSIVRNSKYVKVIEDYYEKYKHLFDQEGYNDIFEFMIGTKDMFNQVSEENDSFIRFVFCIKVAELLYKLNFCNDEDEAKDILSKLEGLDEIYEYDSELSKFKEKKLKVIDDLRNKLSDSKFDFCVDRKVKLLNALKLLETELEKNIISKEGKKKVKEKIENVFNTFNILLEDVKTYEKIDYNCKKVNILLKLSKVFELLGEELYNELVSIQEKLLKLQKEVLENGINKETNLELQECIDVLVKIENKLNSFSEEQPKEELPKVNLKGFVLFDVSPEGDVYVLTDLDASHKDSFVDDTIKPEKLRKGYECYNKLVNDLHLLGDVEKLFNKDSHAKTNRLCEPVCFDTVKREPTGMFRLKEDPNGVERFVEQKVVLHKDGIIYKQVIDIISEILPNVSFDLDDDMPLYICFASAMKAKSEDMYKASLKRYASKSPLYMMFIDDKNKESLTDEECKLLKDYIHLTLQTYIELEKKNPLFNFDIIKQMGGMKTRG